MVTHRSADPSLARPRPIVRSSRLVHRGVVSLGAPTQVVEARPAAEPEPEAPRRPARKRFRFARPLIAATVLSASLARADGPGGTFGRSETSGLAAEVVGVGDEVVVAAGPEELQLTPRLGQVGAAGGVLAAAGEALGAKVDGTKDNPYVAKGLVKRVPRAKRMAWKRIYEEGAGYDKVSDLKGNPYE